MSWVLLWAPCQLHFAQELMQLFTYMCGAQAALSVSSTLACLNLGMAVRYELCCCAFAPGAWVLPIHRTLLWRTSGIPCWAETWISLVHLEPMDFFSLCLSVVSYMVTTLPVAQVKPGKRPERRLGSRAKVRMPVATGMHTHLRCGAGDHHEATKH